MLAKVALAGFNNPMGLEKAGNSTYRATTNSGNPQINAPGGGGVGTLLAGAIEMSNVDLAQEFTNLIIAQRGFQANSRVITTSRPDAPGPGRHQAIAQRDVVDQALSPGVTRSDQP